MSNYIISAAKIFTGNPDLPWAKAIYVKDGKIDAVGTLEEVLSLAPNDVEHIEHPASLITPGLTDGHLHLVSTGLIELDLNLKGTSSIKECRELILAAVANSSPGEWIVGRGWDNNLWDEDREPTKADLDDIAPNNPIFLTRVCGHSAWVNSKALEFAGVDAETKDLAGGKIEKDGTGEPNGLIRETLEIISDFIPVDSYSKLKKAALLAQDKMLSYGLTSVHSLENLTRYNVVKDLDLAGELKLRVYHSLHIDDIEEAEKEKIDLDYASDNLWLGHVKLYADGSLGSGTAYLHEPYSDEPDNKGLPFLDYDELYAGVKFAYERNYGVMIHAIGDQAVTNGLQAIIDARVDFPELKSRDRIEHVQLIKDEHISLFKDNEIIASVQPVFLATDRYMAEKKWGLERCKNSYAWKTLDLAGVKMQFGSDSPIESANPIFGIYTAIKRKSYKDSAPSWFPEQSLSLEGAIIGFTQQASFTAGKEDFFGIIAVGKFADLTVFKDDLFELDIEKLPEAKVEMTIIGGEIVYRA